LGGRKEIQPITNCSINPQRFFAGQVDEETLREKCRIHVPLLNGSNGSLKVICFVINCRLMKQQQQLQIQAWMMQRR